MTLNDAICQLAEFALTRLVPTRIAAVNNRFVEI